MKTSQSIALAAFAALNSAAGVLAGGPYDTQYETYAEMAKPREPLMLTAPLGPTIVITDTR